MVCSLRSDHSIDRTGEATTLDGFPSPGKDKDSIWRNPGVRVRFLGMTVGAWLHLDTDLNILVEFHQHRNQPFERKALQFRLAHTREIGCREAGQFVRATYTDVLIVQYAYDFRAKEGLRLQDVGVGVSQVAKHVCASTHQFKIVVAHRNASAARCEMHGLTGDKMLKTRNLRFSRKLCIFGLKEGYMDMADTIPASEFTRNFGRYRMLAQREAVAVSSHGSITGYFVAPNEYEEFQRFKQHRRSFATVELSDERVQAIGSSRMDERHAHLDTMLDPK
jgi:hypothetical protein